MAGLEAMKSAVIEASGECLYAEHWPLCFFLWSSVCPDGTSLIPMEHALGLRAFFLGVEKRKGRASRRTREVPEGRMSKSTDKDGTQEVGRT